jgi:hypothetical protein
LAGAETNCLHLPSQCWDAVQEEQAKELELILRRLLSAHDFLLEELSLDP